MTGPRIDPAAQRFSREANAASNHAADAEARVEQLRKAIRHGLAAYGTSDGRRILERALEDTR